MTIPNNPNDVDITEILNGEGESTMDTSTTNATSTASTTGTTTIDVTDSGNPIVEETHGFRKSFASRKEAMQMADTLDSLGYQDNYQLTGDGKSIVLTNVTARDVNIIQRKCNICIWADRTKAVANTVTDFATDVADYALNGALAPTAGAVINAGLTTGRVVATAGLTVAAATVATTVHNGRAMVKELKNNKEVKNAWAEVKGLGSDIGAVIFGSSDSDSSSWKAV